MDPRMIPKGAPNGEYTFGEQDGTRRPNEPGVYFHPGANKFIESAGQVRPDGSMAYAQHTGKIQGDAFVQLGYRKASPEEEKEFIARKKEAADALRKREAYAATNKSVSAPRS